MILAISFKKFIRFSIVLVGLLISNTSLSESRGDLISSILGQTIEQLKYHALIIGINGYNPDSGWPPLAYPESDTNRLEKVLTTGYEFDSVTYLRGQKATKAAIRSTLLSFKNNLGPNDALFIFYAGHGYTITEGPDRGGYWVPVDAAKSVESWFSIDELAVFMKQTNARHVLLVSDSCYAGSFFTRGKLTDSELAQNSAGLFAKKIIKPSRYIITSGDMEEVPDKSSFAEYFLSFLENLDRPYITSAENIYYHLKRPVFIETGTHVIAKEMMSGTAGGGFIFAQKQAVNKEGMLILEVSPPNAKVVASKNNDHVSEIILNEDDERISEHRIRVSQSEEISLEVSLEGFHSKELSWTAKSLKRKLRHIRLKEWKPQGFKFIPDQLNNSYTQKQVSNSILARIPLEQQTWNKKQVTATSESKSGKYAAVSTYTKERFLQNKGRHATVFSANVTVIDHRGNLTNLNCYSATPKGKDEKSSREIRDVVFLPQNERYLVALTGDHLFLWDHIESRLISKTKLPTSLKYRENARITISEHRKTAVLAISPEKTKAESVEVLTL